MGCAEGVEGLASGRRRAPRVPRHAVWLVKAAKKKSPEDVCPTLPRLPDLAKVPLCSRQRRKRSCCWAASEPMQPTPLLLSAEEGGRVSRTLVSRVHVRWKCPPLQPLFRAEHPCAQRDGRAAGCSAFAPNGPAPIARRNGSTSASKARKGPHGRSRSPSGPLAQLATP